MTDDFEAAVKAALALLGYDVEPEFGVDAWYRDREKIEAAIRHVGAVARRDALRDVKREFPESSSNWVRYRIGQLLAEAEEAVRRDE